MIAFQNLTSLQLLSLFEIEFCLLISKLSLVNQFDQDLKEKAGVTKCPFSYDSYCKFTGFLMGKGRY